MQLPVRRSRGFFVTEQKLTAAKKTIVSGEVRCFGFGKTLLLCRAERHFQCVNDAARHVVLDFENICQVAVVAVAP
jgi:hypothetical protein